jgi:hypothetical protein
VPIHACSSPGKRCQARVSWAISSRRLGKAWVSCCRSPRSKRANVNPGLTVHPHQTHCWHQAGRLPNPRWHDDTGLGGAQNLASVFRAEGMHFQGVPPVPMPQFIPLPHPMPRRKIPPLEYPVNVRTGSVGRRGHILQRHRQGRTVQFPLTYPPA